MIKITRRFSTTIRSVNEITRVCYRPTEKWKRRIFHSFLHQLCVYESVRRSKIAVELILSIAWPELTVLRPDRVELIEWPLTTTSRVVGERVWHDIFKLVIVLRVQLYVLVYYTTCYRHAWRYNSNNNNINVRSTIYSGSV